MNSRKVIRKAGEREMARLLLVRQRAEISAALACGMPVSALSGLLAGVYGGVTVTEGDVRSFCKEMRAEPVRPVSDGTVPELVRRALAVGGHRISQKTLDVLKDHIMDLRRTELSATEIREYLISSGELPAEVSLSSFYKWFAKEKHAD